MLYLFSLEEAVNHSQAHPTKLGVSLISSNAFHNSHAWYVNRLPGLQQI
jgi:hypothetical protein